LKAQVDPQRSDSELCAYCRTNPTFQSYKRCFLCLICEAFKQNLDPLAHEIGDIGKTIASANQVLAHLDRRFINEVPRQFLIIPADHQRFLEHPRSWLRRKGFTKYYLFFVCEVSHEVISPPIKLRVAKEWVQALAPVLADVLCLLQIAMKVGLNISLELYESASPKFTVEVTPLNIAEMLQEVSAMIDKTSDPVQPHHSQRLGDEAYELVRERALEDKEWRLHMEPVRKPPGAEVVWVSKTVALDTALGYEIVET
jgi:hypothetical protein